MSETNYKGKTIDIDELIKMRTYDARKQIIVLATLNNNVAALVDLLQAQSLQRQGQTQEIISQIFSKMGKGEQ